MSEAINKASKTNFYFAHSFYFYLLSLEKIIGEEDIQIFKKVTDFKTAFMEEMSKTY